jgi:hypothetical protein
MENLDQLMLKKNKIMLAGKSRAKMWFIAGEDYGRQVAWSFSKVTDENKEYSVQGLQAFNWDEAARTFITHYSKARLGILKAPLEMLRLYGRFNRTYANLYMIMKALNNYPEKFESEKTWEELGKPIITLAEYAEKLSKKAK